MAFKHWSFGRKLRLMISGICLVIAAFVLGDMALRIRVEQGLADNPHSGVLPPVGIDNHFAEFQSDPKNASPQRLVNKANSDYEL
jgi:hypothetical protein